MGRAAPAALGPRLAALNLAAFGPEPGWRAGEIDALLQSPGVLCALQPSGFALARVIAPEVELLRLAVHPVAQGRGQGMALMCDWQAQAMRAGARAAFLEVAEDNTAARALYTRCGYALTGRRRAYYRRGDGIAVDALLMSRPLSPE